MNWPGLGLFRISSTKKTKLLGIFEKKRYIFSLSSISETVSIANCPSPGQFINDQILR
ncbi:hypothetical protein L873DRAFT_1797183, partial [Choiromyces venosus 120613-1]